MLKIDKHTHMMILFTFALVFVAVYLYYTIVDIRKMQADIKKSAVELDGLKTSYSKDVEGLISAIKQLQASQTKSVSVNKEVKNLCATTVPVAKQVVKEVKPVEKEGVVDDDSDSITTEDIKATFECDVDDGYDEVSVPVDVNTIATDVNDPIDEILETKNADQAQIAEVNQEIDVDAVKNMKYEELKELCKKMGLNNKGSKDVLSKRILESLNA